MSGLTRRAFLARTGWTAAGLTVLTSCTGLIPVLPHQDPPDDASAVSWVQVRPGGRIRFYCPRMEMGQGASLGLTQAVAEELNVPADAVDCLTPDTSQVPAFKLTVGSESIELFLDPVARAAAALREALRGRAADVLGVAPDAVADAPGGFRTAAGRRLAYAALVPAGGAAAVIDTADLAAAPAPAYRARPDRLAVMGRDAPDPALRDLVTGATVFGRDAKVAGMLHGGALMPPAPGATLTAADGATARTLPGVVAVVIEPDNDLAGVVARHPHQVRDALAAITADWAVPGERREPGARIDAFWDDPDRDFEHTLVDEPGDGDPAPGEARVSAAYATPFLAHAAIEPRTGLASVRDGRAEVWCGTQAPYFVRGRVAQRLGLRPDDVVLHPRRLGGGFGGRVPCQPAETAALLSRAVQRPVKVQWSRADEFRQNYLQPPFRHAIDAAADPKTGAITRWHHDFASAPILFGLKEIPEIAHLVLDRIADKGTARGALPPYRARAKRIRYSDIRLPVGTGAWRGLGTAPNTFAIESMMDELAQAAGWDPVRFRLANLDPARARLGPVIEKAAERAGWGRRLPDGAGLGVAAAVYRGKTCVAAVAEVQIDRAARAWRAVKLWLAQDCGPVINPDRVRQQVAGNAVWGTGLVTGEAMAFDGAVPATDNFDSYAVLRQAAAPAIDVSLIETPEVAPSGTGEPAIGPVAPAIANALFAATGRRLRNLPADPDVLFGA